MRNNNFGILRILAATMVIFSHAFQSLKQPEPFNRLTGGHDMFMNTGYLGVFIFFVISGYLITQSFVATNNLRIFLTKRFLRIMPALILATIFSIFFIGPLTTALPLPLYFENKETWAYLLNLLLYPMQYQLPGVFLTNPYPGVINSVLWTLPIEFTAYLLLACIGMVGLLRKKRLILLATMVLAIFHTLFYNNPPYMTSMLFFMQGNRLVELTGFFLVGSLFFLYQKNISYKPSILLFLFIFWVASLQSSLLHLTSYLFIPYLTLFLAFHPLRFLSKIESLGDPSYGTYLYTWPIQQTIIHFYPITEVLPLFIFSFLISVTLSYISWHLVESRILALKKRL